MLERRWLVSRNHTRGSRARPALHKQLGLRLEGTKGPVEVPVVDRVDRPGVN
jgi:uncharacterized protein (TIGR03435 family)